MKILSLFDGISCARVALDRAGIPVEAYYASEVDKYAMQISAKNYPDIKQLGSVVGICYGKETLLAYPDQGFTTGIDLLIGGSPCQDLSIAKKNRKGLDGERSGLFWEYVRILKEVKPKYFILENVNSMPKEAKAIITETLGVEPIMINAALVSAQNRKRLFWIGERVDTRQIGHWDSSGYEKVNVTQPEDRGILLKDILENGDSDRLKSYCIDANYFKGGKIGGTHQSSKRNYTIRIGQIGKGGQAERIYSQEGKSVGLSALGGGRGAKTGLYAVDNQIRKLSPTECERLQGLEDNYTEGVSNSQRYKMLGNAFNVDVVSHILSFIVKN